MEELAQREINNDNQKQQHLKEPVTGNARGGKIKNKMAHNELKKSIEGYKQLRKTYQIKHGDDHEKTIEISDIIAGQLFQIENYEEALDTYIYLLERFNKTYGVTHNKSLKTQEKITLSLLMMGKSNEFLEALESLCAVYVNELEYTDDELAPVKLMFAGYLEKQENYITAELLLQEVLQAYTTYYGDNNIQCIKIKIRLGDIYTNKSEFDEALSLFAEIYKVLEDSLGPLDTETLSVKRSIANVYSKTGELDTALNIYLELYTNYIECYGGECAETLTIRTSIAATLLKQKNYEQSLNIYMAVYESYLNLPETSRQITTHLKHIIGHIHLKVDRLYEAQTMLRDVLHEYEDLYYDEDQKNINIIESKASIGAVLLKEKKFEESRHCYLEVLTDYKEMYGEQHAKTLQIEDILMDLNELDTMLTSNDKQTIEANVRVNEANNFGSQDFEKFILPKRSPIRKRRDTFGGNEDTKVESDTAQKNENGTQDITNESMKTFEDSEMSPKNDETVESINNILPDNDKIDSIVNESSTQQQSIEINRKVDELNLNKEDSHLLKPEDEEKWEDVNLNSTRDDAEGDIMDDIKNQQLAKRKQPKKHCACCTIS